MTSWSAPRSQIRYYQCPFCQRTHSSLYGEVFRRRAGARIVESPSASGTPEQIPMASPEDVRWARVKQTAARWFERLADEERRAPTTPVAPVRVPARASTAPTPKLAAAHAVAARVAGKPRR